MENKLNFEYRMYGMVPYNLSPIQQGIQFGHAVVDYAQNIKDLGGIEEVYNKWANKDKTFIILNGGTTNTNLERLGSLNIHLATLREAGILVQDFYEPDLGDQLTAICFLVEERVFNRILYPDLPEDLRNMQNYSSIYTEWVEAIGGERNAFLREYLKNLRLA